MLDEIGFYTLTDSRVRRVAENQKGLSNPVPLSRCEILLGARCEDDLCQANAEKEARTP